MIQVYKEAFKALVTGLKDHVSALKTLIHVYHTPFFIIK
jgi:hypothetical protein